jgi:hypothetical protein
MESYLNTISNLQQNYSLMHRKPKVASMTSIDFHEAKSFYELIETPF